MDRRSAELPLAPRGSGPARLDPGQLDQDGGQPAGRRPLLLALLLALALRALYLPDPWSGLPTDFLNHFGAFATGGPATNFLDQGLAFSGGMPYDWGVPLADGRTDWAWYTHHPAGYMLLSAGSMYLFGREEWALRLPALLFSLLSVLTVARLAALLDGRRAGLIAAFVMALLPFSVHFGMQVWTEGALVALGALFLGDFVLWLREERGSRVLRMALWVTLAGLLDWPGHFFWAPAVAWALWRQPRRALALWPVPVLAVSTVLLHWLHVQATLPPTLHAADRANTLAKVFTSPVPWKTFLSNQVGFWWTYAGPLTLLLLALGGWASCGQRYRGLGARMVPSLAWLPGVLYVGLFPGRSFDHSFFGMLALPGVCILAARGLSWLAGRSPLRLSLLLLILGLSLFWSDVRQWAESRSDQIAALVREDWLQGWIRDPNAVLLTHMGRGMCLPFYSRAQVIHSINSAADLDRVLERVVGQLEPGAHAAFFVDGTYLALLPEGGELYTRLGELGPIERHTLREQPYGILRLR